jgi:P-type conjugative transfer protein TrbJ
MGNGGALEITQQMNLAELLKIAYDTMKSVSVVKAQLENMEQQGEQLIGEHWGSTFTSLTKLSQAVRQGESLAYSLSSIDEVYRRKFPSFESYLSRQPSWDGSFYTDKYNEWSQTNRDTIASAMAAVGMQSEEFVSEEVTMQLLQDMSSSSVGRMQAIQAGNQLQKLRQLMMLHLQTQSNYQAWQSDKESMQEAGREKFFSKPSQAIVGDEPEVPWR